MKIMKVTSAGVFDSWFMSVLRLKSTPHCRWQEGIHECFFTASV